MKYVNYFLLLIWIFIGFQNNIKAQPKIEGSVISNGCKSVYGNNVQINGSLGQPIIGIVKNLGNTVYDGFWFQISFNNITDVEQMKPDLLPKEYSLEQNYPNPFNPSTIIQFSLPKQSFVTLRIYDILGKEVATLVNNKQSPGNYEVTFNANNFPSGVYFYQLKSKEFTRVRKMMLVR